MRRQSNDRCAIVFGVSLVAITVFLILDIQTGLNLRGGYLPIPKTVIVSDSNADAEVESRHEEHIVCHENINNADNFDTFGALKQKIGQHIAQIRKLREYMGSRSSEQDIMNIGQIFSIAKDRFIDLKEAVDYMEITDTGSTQAENPPTLADILSLQSNENTTILDKFNFEIKQNELYSEDSETIDALIQEMATHQIAHVEEKEGGTQIKMTMHYDNGMLAIAKPMRIVARIEIFMSCFCLANSGLAFIRLSKLENPRFPRDQQTFENHILYADYERHTADIAAFHLDRLLGFRRAFPVTGRILNMTSEIYNIAEKELRETFFTSLQPYSQLCFYGTCHRYCDIYHPVCGQNGLIEASVIAFFPTYMGAENVRTTHPWRKAYNLYNKAVWERDPKYCEKVKAEHPYNKGRRLLDLIDMAIFDFLTGNMDRHHYEIFKILSEDAFTIHYDNGRGFGRPFYDELNNLAPLVQCSSTLKTLLRFHNGPKPLSQLMKDSMASDPVAPVLWEPHLTALDRRVSIILTALRDCIESHSIHDVVFAHDLP